MNKIYRTVIIDDEESAIDNLCLALKPYGQIVVEGVAHNGAAGLKLIEKVRPDWCFRMWNCPICWAWNWLPVPGRNWE